MENPFESPKLEAREYSPNQPGGSLLRSIAAVLVGGVAVDYFGTRIVTQAVTYVIQLSVADPYALAVALQSFSGRMVILIAGIACSFFGGMAAARIARQRFVLHAMLSVSLAHVLILPQLLFANRFVQPTLTLLMMLTCFLAAAFAGKMVAPSKSLIDDEASE